MTANDELIVSLALAGPPPFPFGALVHWLHRRRALRKYWAFYNAAFGNDLTKTLAALLIMETEQQIAKAAWLAHQPSQRTDFFTAYEALLLGVVLRGRDEVATLVSGRIANEIVASLCKLALFRKLALRRCEPRSSRSSTRCSLPDSRREFHRHGLARSNPAVKREYLFRL
jgi:hypothetical protein